MELALLQVEHVQKIYQPKGGAVHKALDGVSFEVEEGSFVAIMGPSGSGKTTLLNLIAGLDRPTGGSVVIGRQRIEGLDEDVLADFRRKAIGFVFQDFNLLDPLTVEENVILPLTLEKKVGRDALNRVHDVLKRLGLYDKRHRFPYELSGGEKQRVAIARAIVHRPLLILADEPTGNLDSAMSRVILETFGELNRTMNITVLMVTHDPFAASYAERVLLLKDGRLYAELVRGDGRTGLYQKIIDALSSLEGTVASR
ncbi:MAG: ABC transporter ATP-binding protein [Hydrogenibacillus sp.]|nr:ABC transporter ATP-binding protein [Hydrogenibacillus sp.]